MSVNILSGRFNVGQDCQVGRNVIVDVAEEVTIGDRCVIADNTYFCGRRIQIGNDFYGYSHWGKRLEIGLGRRTEELAVLKVGDRCTFHDNKIDLSRHVVIGDNVGLSPEVTIYTHYYWQSPFHGHPMRYDGVSIGNDTFVGFRSILLPGSYIAAKTIIGAGSIVSGNLSGCAIYGGNPAKFIRDIKPVDEYYQKQLARELMDAYARDAKYRGIETRMTLGWPVLHMLGGAKIDLVALTIDGEETPESDDLREFLFKHGIRIYTKRPFKKLEICR